MRIPHSAVPALRTTTVVAFVAACAVFFGFLWTQAGGRIPLLTETGYEVSFPARDVDNLVYYSDVMVAGVKVGKVADVRREDGRAWVTLGLDEVAAPVHEGATLQIRSKSLIEESYVEITDGHGPAVPADGTLPATSVRTSVQLHDVLAGLDARSRESLGRFVRSLAAGTDERRADVSALLGGLGDLGREGRTAMDALAAQEQDLRSLTRNVTVLLAALDTQEGQIAQLVQDADTLTAATAGQRQDLAATMRELPPTLTSAQRATGELGRLSQALAPVAADLDAASPHLGAALVELPATTRELRGLLPALDSTLDRAPATLGRVQPVARDLRTIMPSARVSLADLNPVLGYLQPYGRDLSAFFANVSAALARTDTGGHYLRILLVFNEQSLRQMPLSTNSGPFDKSNAYPPPGGAANPGPFTGRYPRVERDRR